MPHSASFTFYGLVDDDSPPGPELGARAQDGTPYGFDSGTRVAAYLRLSGSAAETYLDVHEAEGSASISNAGDMDFYFPIDGYGRAFTEEDVHSAFIRSNGTDLSIIDFGVPITEYYSQKHSVELVPNQDFAGGVMVFDSQLGSTLMISGAWLPDDVGKVHQSVGTGAGEILRSRGDVSLLWGQGGDDTILIGSGSGYAWGGHGRDTLRGGDDEDQLWGGFGNDSIRGGDGSDLLNGQYGDDTISGGDGEDTIYGGENPWPGSIETELGDDLMRGDSGDDVIVGNGGDTLLGGSGDDTLTGAFREEEYPREAPIFLDGGSGDDRLIAAVGGARLKGGGGEDEFYVGWWYGSVIEDFKPGKDRLRIDPESDDEDLWTTYEELIARARQDGDDVVFQAWSQAAEIRLRDVGLDELSSGDFII